jgi:ubiquinone/menaquinone biosynthesis C-methylase UbiE
MELFRQIKWKLKGLLFRRKEMAANLAYDLWAPTYDAQPNNLVVYLNELIFDEMIATIDIENKIIVDIGCGTGKQWGKIFSRNPAELTGYEISHEMLRQLRQKYPEAKTHISHDNHLTELNDESCDVIISTLVIGHISDLTKAFSEWNRVTKRKAVIFITDFHAEMLSKGANRSFQHKEEIIPIKTYKYSIPQIKVLAKSLNWELIKVIEKKVDDSVKHFYKGPQSLEIFKKAFGTPLVYGCLFRKIG